MQFKLMQKTWWRGALSALVCGLAVAVLAVAPLPALAQDKGSPVFQIKLNESQVKGYLKIATKLADVMERLDKAEGKPGKKLTADIKALGRTGGFKSFQEMDDVVATITFVMSGMDGQTGDFMEPRDLLKAELKETQADKELKGKEKKEAIQALKEAIAQTPKLKHPGNVTLLKKYLKELAALAPPEPEEKK